MGFASVMGVTTYQTKLISIGVVTRVLRQAPVGHPRIHKGERRGDGAEPEERNHVRMLQSLPHDPIGP